MASEKQLCIGLSLAVTWLSGNGWRRPDSQVEEIHSLPFYTALARRAERAKLDFIFRPDSLFIDPQVLESSPGFSSMDPTLLMAALAAETSRIGLVTTASTTFNHPYSVARQIQSLHQLSAGRAGWNVVTALDGHNNFGIETMPGADERYDRATEFTAAVQALWNSYPASALRIDRGTGQYAEAAQVRAIDHHGHYFDIAGPLTLPAHPSGSAPLFQAGASDTGRDFAARIADAIFAATPDLSAAVELRRDLRGRAQRYGRPADAVRVLPGLSLFLAETTAEAQALYRETQSEQSYKRKLAFVRDALGIDPAQLPPDQPITPAMLAPLDVSVRSRTHAQLLRRLIERESPSLERLLQRPETSGSAHWLIVGTPEEALTEISRWAEAEAIDGFIALPGGNLGSLKLVCDRLIPALSTRGLFREEYAGQTLRSHLGME